MPTIPHADDGVSPRETGANRSRAPISEKNAMDACQPVYVTEIGECKAADLVSACHCTGPEGWFHAVSIWLAFRQAESQKRCVELL